jgi:hypothetical protein
MAAGLGFKTFNTGDVLSAADTNGYLMQGVLVFADSAARSAAITSPQEGQMSFLKDTNSTEYYSGSAWVAVGGSVPTSYGSTAGKNAIINAGMEVWQRGTSISVSASSAPYTTDRWVFSTGASAASTVSRQATSDTTNLPTIQYCARVQRNSGQTGTSANYFAQSLETINSIRYVGQSASLSFYARKGANFSGASDLLGAFLVSGTGTDQNVITAYTGTATVATSNVTLTTTWQRFTITGTVATTATELAAYFSYTPSGTASTNDYYEITGVQLELGSSATTFSRNASTYQGELAACQRYYYAHAVASGEQIGSAVYNTTTESNAQIKFPVTMRTTPTLSATTGASNYVIIVSNTNDVINSLTIFGASPNAAGVFNTSESSGTAGTAGRMQINNSSGFVAFVSEL